MQLPHLSHAFLPATSPSRALVIVLHGRGDSMDGFFWLPEALGLPAVNYLFLDAPDAYFGGFSWYGLPPNQGPGILRSRALLFDVLDALRLQGWPSERVVLFGFSQGCLIALDVGLRYPHRLGGICGVSGYVHFIDEAAAEAVPAAFESRWLVTHGSEDAVLPLAATREQVARLRALGLPIAWHEFAKAHTIDPGAELALLRTWLAAACAGPAPDATGEPA